MNNACVVGYGVVGQATALAFGINNYYDIDPEKSTITLQECSEYEYIFICLPTPTEMGVTNTNSIEILIGEITEFDFSKKHIFIIRSTVPVGFTKELRTKYFKYNVEFVSNPEFLSEKTAESDALHPDIVVVGGDNVQARYAVVAMYKARFKYVEPIVGTSVTAELIKYTLNAFFATKVVFGNQIYDFAQQHKANYITIREVLEKHKWGSKNHFDVFHQGGRGAGGRCLPKDLESFVNQSESELLATVQIINEDLLEESKK